MDTAGDVQYVVRDGDPVADPQWQSCRVVLTTKRLVLATSETKQQFPHSKIALPDDPESVVPDGTAADGAALKVGESVLLVDAPDLEDFQTEYCRAALHGQVILAKHPAIVGGVLQEDASWGKARFQLDDGLVTLQFPGGDGTSFAVDDVGTVETSQSTVLGEQRDVVAVEHTDEADRSVETHVSGMAPHTNALATLFARVVDGREADYELTDVESQVLMGLYSGVSPFEMGDFVGIGPDEVEEIYQRLLDAGAVDEVRTRTEVALNAQGRNMASEAMSEQ